MKIAITGGAGLIGSYLTQAYLNAGHDVLVIDNLVYGFQQRVDPRVRFYQVDIRDRNLSAILQRERPDVVSYHVAQQHIAMPVEQSLADADVHVRGLLNVLNSCVDACVKKVLFASGGNSLYRCIDAALLPISEDTPLCPRSAHDVSKVAGEWYVRYYTQQYGLKHTILRYADVYSEMQPLPICRLHHPLNYFLRMLAKCQPPIIRGIGDELRDHIFVDDVVQANLCALKQGENQTIHISSGEGNSLNQIYQIVAQLMGSKLCPIYLSGSREETYSIVLDNTRAQRLLGWRPEVSLAEGIQRAVNRLRDGALPVASKSEVPIHEDGMYQKSILTIA